MRFLIIAAVSLMLFAPLATPSRAGEWDKKTSVTFDQPLEVPGRVLTPGTYVFKLLDSQSDRHTVEVYNKDQSKLITTLITVPDERLRPSGKTIMTFEERPARSPEALRAWFYPGDTVGQEFVYPESRARQIAKASGQHVLSMRDQSGNKTEIRAIQPSGEDVSLKDVHSH